MFAPVCATATTSDSGLDTTTTIKTIVEADAETGVVAEVETEIEMEYAEVNAEDVEVTFTHLVYARSAKSPFKGLTRNISVNELTAGCIDEKMTRSEDWFSNMIVAVLLRTLDLPSL